MPAWTSTSEEEEERGGGGEKEKKKLMYTTSQKFGQKLSFHVFSFIMMTIYMVTEGIKTRNKHIWNYVVKQKKVNSLRPIS